LCREVVVGAGALFLRAGPFSPALSHNDYKYLITSTPPGGPFFPLTLLLSLLSHSSNGIGSDGAFALSISLAGLTSMQTLDIRCRRPLPSCYSSLLPALASPRGPVRGCSARVGGCVSSGWLLPAAAGRLVSRLAPSSLLSLRPPLVLSASAGAPAGAAARDSLRLCAESPHRLLSGHSPGYSEAICFLGGAIFNSWWLALWCEFLVPGA
jgi:hypothetical protein